MDYSGLTFNNNHQNICYDLKINFLKLTYLTHTHIHFIHIFISTGKCLLNTSNHSVLSVVSLNSSNDPA